jgi:hypothetical protein
MTQDRPHTPDDRPPYAPGVTHERLADRWPTDAWRGPFLGVLLGVLTLPAVATVLVALLVLAVRGEATWLVVAGAALVTTLLGALGTGVALRRGHPGVLHRVALLAGVWGVAVLVAGVVVALTLDVPERVGVAVMLVVGGTYTLVLALALWGASRVLPAPAQSAAEGDAPVATPTSAPTPTVDEVPTPAAAPDDDADLADWPAWGGDAADPAAADLDGGAPPAEEVVLEDVVDAEVVEPAPPVPPTRPAQPTRSPEPTRPAEPARPARTASSRPMRPVDPAPPAPDAAAPSRPPRRSVTSGGTGTPRRTGPASPGPATERIDPQDGDGGAPTQRLPPVVD